MTDTQVVNAIQARIDGRYDDPDLLLVGALHDHMGDIVEILSMRDQQFPVSTEERERTFSVQTSFTDAEVKRLIGAGYVTDISHGQQEPPEGGEVPIEGSWKAWEKCPPLDK
jgi:hypothetical protein